MPFSNTPVHWPSILMGGARMVGWQPIPLSTKPDKSLRLLRFLADMKQNGPNCPLSSDTVTDIQENLTP